MIFIFIAAFSKRAKEKKGKSCLGKIWHELVTIFTAIVDAKKE